MAEDGLLDIDEDINAYLTSWTLPASEFSETEKVTIRRITNHSAGTTVWGVPGYARSAEIPEAPVTVVRCTLGLWGGLYKPRGESGCSSKHAYPEDMATEFVEAAKSWRCSNPIPLVAAWS
jgi:hypothetical protein